MEAGLAPLALVNGRVATLDRANPEVSAVLAEDGRFAAAGSDAEIRARAAPTTRFVDLARRRVVPGLNDSHTHLIRGGLSYNLELRWDGVASLADAMAMLRDQVARTPPPQWVRVVGGFCAHQFAERRLPTLEEINRVAPETPVFILHLYDRALLNRAALRAIGYTRETQPPPASSIERDARGEPTGLLLATPNARILYAALGSGPRLAPDDQLNSTRMFMRELNRLGITSVIDAGGGSQSYPDDYRIVGQLADEGGLTVRIAYNLFTQNPGGELSDFRRWSASVAPRSGSDMYRLNGAGEMLAYSAADFEDFRQSRPDLPVGMEPDLEAVVHHLAQVRWPFRLHATYDETISRALDVFEKVDRDVPLSGVRWFFDHAETISPRNIERVRALGGGIAIQHRMAYQGEYFAERYGEVAARRAPPIRRMLEAGITVGAGTDATRVASYNPWIGLYWLVTGRTVGGYRIYDADNRLDREIALRLWTEGSSWFSGDEAVKGRIAPGCLADLAVLSRDYFSVPEEDIKDIRSVLTVVGGRIVHGDNEFRDLAPPLPRASPDWSPVNVYGGYQHGGAIAARTALRRQTSARCRHHAIEGDDPRLWGSFGCACGAF